MAAKQSPIEIKPNFDELYPKGSALATECAMNLVFTAEVLVKRISELLQAFKLSPASGLVLSMLADSETFLSPYEIADRLIITRATVTGLIDSLERRGYARRIPHTTDRRMLLIEITEAGRRVADEFRPVVHQKQKEWLEVLSEAEKERLIEALHLVQGRLVEGQ